jgi:hypothetical protein
MPAHLATAALAGLADLHPEQVCRQAAAAGFASFDLPLTWISEYRAALGLARIMSDTGLATGCGVWPCPDIRTDDEELRRQLGRLALLAPQLRLCGVDRILVRAPSASVAMPLGARRAWSGQLERLRDGVAACGLRLALEDRLLDLASGAADQISQVALGPAMLQLMGPQVEVILTLADRDWERWPAERICDLRLPVDAPTGIATPVLHRLCSLGRSVPLAIETPQPIPLTQLAWLTADALGRSLGLERMPPASPPWPRAARHHPGKVRRSERA